MKGKNLVIDTSVAVKWVNKQDENYIKQSDMILKDVQEEKKYILMPELAKYEVGNALLYKQMPLQNTLGSIATYYSIPIQFVPQDQYQAQETAKIAYENKITFYDATFIALAKENNAQLITDNPKHQRARMDGVKITSLKDYK